MSAPLRIAALISGGGRTLMNIVDRIDAGVLPAQVELVISSRSSATGNELARGRGLDVRVATISECGDENAVHDTISSALRECRIDLVCLCGYLRWFRVDPEYRERVMNIHPALLPDFGGKGMHGAAVHRAVLAAQRRFSGCTVHFVDEHYDHGPTIVQRVCPVLPDDDPDTLATRVFEQECLAYPHAIELFAAQRLRCAHGRVEVAPRTGTV